MSEKFFSKNHCSVEIKDGKAIVGITDFVLKITGKIYHVNLCDEDDITECGEIIGDIEAKKTVFDIISPLSGTVFSVNDAVIEKPTLLNIRPKDNHLIEFVDFELDDELMNEEEYLNYISGIKIKRRGASV